jgi:hypothetical protein
MTKRQSIQYNDQKTDNTIQWLKDRQYNTMTKRPRETHTHFHSPLFSCFSKEKS